MSPGQPHQPPVHPAHLPPIGAPGPSTSGAAELLTLVERRAAEAEEAVARARRHADALRAVRGRGEYRGVAVQVDAQGLLTDVRFVAGCALGPQASGHAVHTAYRAAVRDLLGRLERVALETWGEGATARSIVAEATGRLGVTAPGAGL